MIELESHAKTKRSELPLGFGNAADCAASYNPQKGQISITIADGEKHSYVLICSYADWRLLNERITAGLSFLHQSVEIPPTPITPPGNAIIAPQKTVVAAAEAKTPDEEGPQEEAPPKHDAAYFSKGAIAGRAAAAAQQQQAAAEQPQESRGLPPVPTDQPAPDFDPVTGEIVHD